MFWSPNKAPAATLHIELDVGDNNEERHGIQEQVVGECASGGQGGETGDRNDTTEAENDRSKNEESDEKGKRKREQGSSGMPSHTGDMKGTNNTKATGASSAENRLQISVETIKSVEVLEGRLSTALEAYADSKKGSKYPPLIVGIALEAAVANCSLPDALRRGGLWGSEVLAKWSDGLRSIRSVRSNDDVDSLFSGGRMHSFEGLRRLDLSGSNLSSLSGSEIRALTQLEYLDLSDNSLAILPKELGSMRNLKTLICQRNSLRILPGELGHLHTLERLDFKSNRLSSILISFANMKNLVHLNMDDNPLGSFPDLSPCTRLRSLAFASVQIEDQLGDDVGSRPSRANVEHGKGGKGHEGHLSGRSLTSNDARTRVVTAFDRQQSSKALVINFWGAPKESDPVQEFYDLALKGSTHHPLIIRGLATMIASQELKKAFLENKQALEKVALMLLSECAEVVTNACRVMGILSMNDRVTADRILNSHGDILLSLVLDGSVHLDGDDEGVSRRVAGLMTIETITRFASSVDHHQLEEKLVHWAISMSGWEDDPVMHSENQGTGLAVNAHHAEQLKVTLLRILGNLYCGDQRIAPRKSSWRDLPEFAAFVAKVRGYHGRTCGQSPVSLSVKRLTSILGLHSPPRHPAGVRILALDGGGMKGLATIRLLRGIEKAAKRPVQELFDLVVGTSTGALLAVAMMVKGMSLDECEVVYKELGHRVFKHPLHSAENKDGNCGNQMDTSEPESWADVFYRSFHMKTEHVRAVVVGCKHDTSTYEEILKDRCSVESIGSYKVDAMIDTSALDVPKLALVSALTSISPVEPFIFRNYEYSCDALANKSRMGSSSHAVWEAVRASSAATYYLDGFKCGGMTFVDGALVANNPSLVALQEAHRIWPNEKIQFLLSVGVGSTPSNERQESLSSYIDTGSALLESATDVEEVHRAMEVISNLVPDLIYERLAPRDKRCDMELDCVDPVKWLELEAAADEYIDASSDRYDRIAKVLSSS